MEQRRWRWVAFLASASAAAIHFGAVHSHLAEYAPAGIFMLLSGAAQMVWAVWVARGAPAWVLTAGIVVNAELATLWLVSRTVGLPFGMNPGVPEDVHATDVLATAMELGIVIACFALLRVRTPRINAALVRIAIVGALSACVASGHDPLHERLVATAALTLALAARAVAPHVQVTIARPSWRSNDAKAAAGNAVGFGAGARAAVGARW